MRSAKTDIPTSIRSEDVDVKVEVKNVDVGAKGTSKAAIKQNEVTIRILLICQLLETI